MQIAGFRVLNFRAFSSTMQQENQHCGSILDGREAEAQGAARWSCAAPTLPALGALPSSSTHDPPLHASEDLDSRVRHNLCFVARQVVVRWDRSCGLGCCYLGANEGVSVHLKEHLA